jgi:hypothetical protein
MLTFTSCASDFVWAVAPKIRIHHLETEFKPVGGNTIGDRTVCYGRRGQALKPALRYDCTVTQAAVRMNPARN